MHSRIASRNLTPFRHHGQQNTYYLAADDEEAERLDSVRILVRTLFVRNVLALIVENPSLIFDVVTGSGMLLPGHM